MNELRPTNRFLRDLELARKRGKDLLKLEAIIDAVAQSVPLEPKHRMYRLQGDMKGLWECHVEPDWLLIWDETEDTVTLIRTGTHADLFD